METRSNTRKTGKKIETNRQAEQEEDPETPVENYFGRGFKPHETEQPITVG